jgi:uncharacterized protein (DUF2132 family)
MNNKINYQNSPLHGLSLKNLLVEMTDHYGFEILFAYLNINCFKTNPSIDSSVKFLKKTEWARTRVEAFYLYEFKNLPRASAEQFLLSPRDRVIPEDQIPGAPRQLSFEDADRLREKRAKKAAERSQEEGHHSGKSFDAQRGGYSNDQNSNHTQKDDHESSNSPSPSVEGKFDPWAKSKNRSK